MKSKIIWLRVSYWAAAIADFVIAISVLIPERVGLTEFVYPMGLMSAVALSWGILLLLADRKPVERRWVLIPTMIVIALLVLAGIYSVLRKVIEVDFVFLIIGLVLLFVLLYSYIITKDVDEWKKNGNTIIT